MEKYDVKKAYKDLYSPGRRDFALVTVPRFGYFAVDGHGDPNTATEYSEALEALYSVSYSAKFASKKELIATSSLARWKGCGGQMIPRCS